MEINFSFNSENDITFIDLHRYMIFVVFEKKYKYIDMETQKYMIDLENKYYGLKKIKEFPLEEINLKKSQIEDSFKNQMNKIMEQYKNLNLIKEILEIDFNYFYKELQNIKNILKNDNFRVSIEMINNKIVNNYKVSDEEIQKINLYNKLVNQKNYIEKIVLSKTIIKKSSEKEEIKKEIFSNMKQIEKETMIFIKEQNIKISSDYKKIIESYNDDRLQRMLNKVDKTFEKDETKEFLLYKTIENLRKLTNKSYKEINIIISDYKFKEKLFGNLQINTLNEKLQKLSIDINKYNQINNYLESTKKIIFNCPLCNYRNDRPINVILHLSIHNTKIMEPFVYYTYTHENKKYISTTIEPKDNNIGNYIYNLKQKIFPNEKIYDTVFQENLTEKLPTTLESSNDDKQIQKIIYKKDNKEFAKTLKTTKMVYGKLFNMKNFVNDVIDKETKRMSKNKNKTTKIVNFKIFKEIIKEYVHDDDIQNFYNTIINLYDDNIKVETSNTQFDILFKNIIHYDDNVPVTLIYKYMKTLFKIIKNIQKNNFGKIFFDNIKKMTGREVDVELSQYFDYEALIMILPMMKNNTLSDKVIERLDFVNKDNLDKFNPTSWVKKDEYTKIFKEISRFNPSDITIIKRLNPQSTDLTDDIIRLTEMFSNLDTKYLKNLEKKFDSIFNIYKNLMRNKMFLHDIQKITSNKDIEGKYIEYINSSFLLITLQFLNKIISKNTDNIDNTKKIVEYFFSFLSMKLTKESNYLKKNTVRMIKTKIIRNNIQVDNKDDLLNDYFDSEEEEEDIEYNEEMNELFGDDEEEMNELFGDDEDDLF